MNIERVWFLWLCLPLSLAWVVYCLLVWAGIAAKEPKRARQATAAGAIIGCATFLPRGQHGVTLALWLVASILWVLGALILLMVKGEGGPVALKALGRAKYTVYMTCIAVAIICFLCAALQARSLIWSTILVCLGFLLAGTALLVAGRYLRRFPAD